MDAAARAYFDVPTDRLTQFQAASLAATLPHPLTSNSSYRSGRMAWRRDLILARLRGGDTGLSPIPEQPAPLELPPVESGTEPAPETPGPPPLPADTAGAESVDGVDAAPLAAPDLTPEPPPDTLDRVR